MDTHPNPGPVQGSPLVSEFAHDPDMCDLIALFVEEMPERVATLESLTRSRDLESLKRLAHQLKGASGGYGFRIVGSAAGTLEDLIKASTQPGTTEQELARIEAQVKDLINLCRRVAK